MAPAELERMYVGPRKTVDHMAEVARLVAAWDDILLCAAAVNVSYDALPALDKQRLTYVALCEAIAFDDYDDGYESDSEIFTDDGFYAATMLDPAAVVLGFATVPGDGLSEGTVPEPLRAQVPAPLRPEIARHADRPSLVIDVDAARSFDYVGAQNQMCARLSAIAATAKKILG